MDLREFVSQVPGVLVALPVSLFVMFVFFALLLEPLGRMLPGLRDNVFFALVIVTSILMAIGIHLTARHHMRSRSPAGQRIQRIVLTTLNVIVVVFFVLAVLLTTTMIEKPVIYLYPSEPTDVFVDVEVIGFITETDPLLGSGWYTRAEPDGTLSNGYPYLFYEAMTAPPRTIGGWRIEAGSFDAWAAETLPLLGFSDREAYDFAEYWSDRMPDRVVDIRIVDPVWLDVHTALVISPEPDVVIRRSFVFSDAQGPAPNDPGLASPDRVGFVVFEWGGAWR